MKIQHWAIILKRGNVMELIQDDRPAGKYEFSPFVQYKGYGYRLEEVNHDKCRVWYSCVTKNLLKSPNNA